MRRICQEHAGAEPHSDPVRSLFGIVRWLARGVPGQGGRSRLAFHVVSIPGEIALQAVREMRRGFEFMELAGIYDEFRLSAKGSQGLVHLFAPENRNVPVDTASHEKRGRGDVFHFVEKGQLVPYGV